MRHLAPAVVDSRCIVQMCNVLASPFAAPQGERSGATTLPLRPPCQFAHSPLHTRTTTRGRRVRKLAVPLSRRSWRRFSHAPPTLSAFGEPANQRHASCSSEESLRFVQRAQLSRRCFADSPRRAPACAGAAHARASLSDAAPGAVRLFRHVSTAVTPVADRESLLRSRRGNRHAGRPAANSLFVSVRPVKARIVVIFRFR